MLLLCANFSLSLSRFWMIITFSKTSAVWSQQESFTLPGKYSQASSCKRFRLSCQYGPSHQKWFVITSMICIKGVCLGQTYLWKQKNGLSGQPSRVIFVNENCSCYTGSDYLTGFKAADDRSVKQPVHFTQINQQNTFGL